FFGVMVDDASTRVKAMFFEHVHSPQSATPFIAVRGVDHDRKLDLLGQLDLRAQILVLECCLFVIAKFADCNGALLDGEIEKHIKNRFGEGLIVGFLWVETDAAIMTNTELSGAKLFETNDGR